MEKKELQDLTEQQAVEDRKSTDSLRVVHFDTAASNMATSLKVNLGRPQKTVSTDTLEVQKEAGPPLNPMLVSMGKSTKHSATSVRTSPSFNYPPDRKSQASNLRNQLMRPRSSSANDATGSREKSLAKSMRNVPTTRAGYPSILSLSGTASLPRRESISKLDNDGKGSEKRSILARLLKREFQTQATDEERPAGFSDYTLDHLFGEEYNVANAGSKTNSFKVLPYSHIFETRQQESSKDVSNTHDEATLLREMTSENGESKEISDDLPAQYENLQAVVQGLFSRGHPSKESWWREGATPRREEISQTTSVSMESQPTRSSPRFQKMGKKPKSDVATVEEEKDAFERGNTIRNSRSDFGLGVNVPLEANRNSDLPQTEDDRGMLPSNFRTSVSSLQMNFDTGSPSRGPALLGMSSIPTPTVPNAPTISTSPSGLHYPPSTPVKPFEKVASLRGIPAFPKLAVKQTLFDFLKHPFEESPETTWNLIFPGGLESIYNSYCFQISLKSQRIYLLQVMVCLGFSVFWAFTSRSNNAIVYTVASATAILLAGAAFVVSYKPVYEHFWISVLLGLELVTSMVVQLAWFVHLSNDSSNQFAQVGAHGHVNPDVILFLYNVYFVSPLPMRYRPYPTMLLILSQLFLTAFLVSEEDIDLISDFLIYLSTNIVGIFFSYIAEINSRQSFLKTRMLFENQKRLAEAREQSERLLKTILPTKVIEGIKRSRLNIKNNLEAYQANMVLNSTFSELTGVTILFADLAGFTEFSGSVSASQLVNFIGEIFYKFDSIADCYGLEKIKTIGDCYNLCGGVPEAPRGEEQIRQYAEDICQMALRMIVALENITEKRNLMMKMRVGIHTGTVLGGVIGRKKFKYDVWSEDVDIASSMEQSGSLNIPHVSSTTFFYAKHNPSLQFSLAEPKWTVKPFVTATYNLYQEAFHVRNDSRLLAQEFGAQTERIASIENLEGHAESTGQEKPPWDHSMCMSSANVLTKEIDISQQPLSAGNYSILKSSKTKSSANTSKSLQSEKSLREKAKVQGVNKSKTRVLKGVKAMYDNAFIESIKTERKLFWGLKGEVGAWTNVFRDPSKELDFKQDYMKTNGRILIVTAGFNMAVFAILNIVYARRSDEALTLIPVTAMVVILIAILWATSRSLETHHQWQHPGKSDNKQSSLWITSIETVGDKMKAPSAGQFISWWAPNTFAVAVLLCITVGNILAMPDSDYYHACSWVILSLHSTFHGIRMQYMNLLVWAAAALLECAYTLTMHMRSTPIVYPAVFGYTVIVAMLICSTNCRHDLLVRRSFLAKRTLESKSLEIRTIQRDAEMLILNILPLSVVQRLKEEPGVRIADNHDFAAILFAGIVNFIPFNSAGQALAVKLLNETISMFDDCCNAHDVEKIKIIGTKYMAITTDMDQTVPDPTQAGRSFPSLHRRTGHVRRMIEYAFDIQQALEQINEDFNQSFGLKIGISAGPVVSGIIGSNKFSWDCWGDAVNVASRMESSGAEGSIQITQDVYEAVADGPYLFQEREQVLIKGKGMMTTYFVTRKPFHNTGSNNGDENVAVDDG